MSSPDAGPAAPTLKRVAGRWEIVGIALNDVIGSGVYLLPAAVVAVLGSAGLWAVLAAGVTIGLVALCFAEAASYFDEPGSAYLYTRTAFGDFVGFNVGWMAWLTRVAAVASLSVGFAQALEYLFPEVGSGWPRTLAISIPLIGFAVINVVGVKAGVRTASVFVIGKIVPLVFFAAVGLFFISPEVFRAQQATQPGGLAAASLVLLFAFVGFENTTVLAGEYKNPQRDIPFALIAQSVFATLLYLAVMTVCMGVLPGLAESSTPVADAADVFLGSWGGLLLTAGAVVSIAGTVSNSVLAGPRYLFALAHAGLLPSPLARVHSRFRTPAIAVVLQTAISLPLALTGGFVELAALSIVSRLITYIGTALALPRLRRKFSGMRGFRLPGGMTIPILVVLISLGLGAAASRRNLISAGIALAVGSLLYALRPWISRPPAD